jgi:wyosine [tRNA(Phe)-imidazoG37] synthetase (radical SAM superfamily)
MEHLGNNAAEANRRRNISATMQRKQIGEETSRQQCSGGKSAKKHLGNNAAEANQQRNTSATMQRKQIGKEISWQQCSGGKSAKKHLGNNAAETNRQRNILATMQRRQIGEETSRNNQSKLCFSSRFALSLLQQNQQKQYKSHTIMSTIIYDKVVFGPIHSRRLGISLGVNLLPTDGKRCSFNCIYCECGLNEQHPTRAPFPTREEVKRALTEKLEEMKLDKMAPDVITFAGNGEPTLHPDFEAIIDDTIALRNLYFPKAKIAVLSNSTMIEHESVFRALNKVEDNLMKLDSVLDRRIGQIDQPQQPSFSFEKLLPQLCRFNGNLIIQTMFLKGTVKGESVDNTTEAEVSGFVEAMKKIRPKEVMLYTIDRETPYEGLEKIPFAQLNAIAEKVRALGIPTTVSA